MLLRKKIYQSLYPLMLATLILAATATGLLALTGNEAQAAPLLTGENGVRDTVTSTNLSNAGVTQTLTAVTGDGFKFTNTGKEFVTVANGYTDTVTMTIVTGGTVGGLAIADVDIVLTAGTTKLAGPFETSIFNQTSTTNAGKVFVNFNAAVTGTVANSVTLAVYKMN